ncbi:MAG TPA: carboxypeptidase-like regulatory domain-containing protein [Acidobacteriaceae bacterium]|nr:carboxypeptidase-like regulatory domain-containing protein [Acidobacteriaceae bacterium]
MKKFANPMQFARKATVILGSLGMVATFTVATPAVLAQQSAMRTVQGRILDKGGAALKGATVFLKDGHTLAVRSYIAGDDGGYHFAQLSPNTDYQLWAESDGKKSGVKTISSFDSKQQVTIDLKIDK